MDLAAWVQTKTSGHWFACHNNNTTQFKVAELLEDFFVTVRIFPERSCLTSQISPRFRATTF